jgi:hypothetical protein
LQTNLPEDEDNPDRLGGEPRLALSAVEKQARVKLLTDVRAKYLELQQRKIETMPKGGNNFLQGSCPGGRQKVKAGLV